MKKIHSAIDFQEELEKARNLKAKAEARIEEATATLKREFGVESLDEARKLLEQLKKEARRLERKFREAEEEFDELWSDHLTESDE